MLKKGISKPEMLEEELRIAKQTISALQEQLQSLTDGSSSPTNKMQSIDQDPDRQGINFYKDLLNKIPFEISVFDRNKKYIYINNYSVSPNLAKEEILGKTITEYCETANLPHALATNRNFLFNSAVFEKQAKTWEEFIEQPDGSQRFYLRTMIPVLYKDDSMKMMLSFANDITEQVMTEKIVRNSEERYRLMVNGASEYALIQTDNHGNVLSWNTGAVNITGYEPMEVMGKSVDRIYTDTDAKSDLLLDDLNQVNEKERMESERNFIRKGGEIFPAHISISKLYNLHNEMIGYAFMMRDLTHQVQSEEALRKSEEKYRSMIENMHLGLIETDHTNIITYVNHSFISMSGIEAAGLVGISPEEAFLNQSEIRVLSTKSENGTEGKFLVEEVNYKNKSQENNWWLISVTPRYDERNSFIGSLAVILDITERKLLETELDEALRNAEVSANAKQIFLANMSHELRTPLNAVIGLSRILQKENMNERQQNYVRSIVYSGNNLLNIIEDILDFSKLEAGKMKMQPVPLNLSELLKSTIEMLQFRSEEKGIDLQFEVDQKITPTIISDPIRLNQIIINLIGNAIKFTHRGYVRVSCSVVEETDATQTIRFVVKDTGIGIPKDNLEKVFEMFYQVDYANPALNSGGTGLGLSITKQLIEMLGGTINITSTENIGTTIEFSLRFEKGSPLIKEIIQKNEVDEGLLKGKRILLAEDNEINRILVVALLERLGVKVCEVENGHDVLNKLKTETFDLVLMDIRMPELNGLQATVEIRKTLKLNLPVIALTADLSGNDGEEWISAGMDDFVVKPFEEEELLSKICKHLNLSKDLYGMASASKNETIPVQIGSSLNQDKLHKISNGDSVFRKRILTIFRDQITAALTEANEAIKNQDNNKLKEILHKIKPGVINTCSTEIGKMILELESQIPLADFQALRNQWDSFESHIQSVITEIQREVDLNTD